MLSQEAPNKNKDPDRLNEMDRKTHDTRTISIRRLEWLYKYQIKHTFLN